jgi:hypothetical protein
VFHIVLAAETGFDERKSIVEHHRARLQNPVYLVFVRNYFHSSVVLSSAIISISFGLGLKCNLNLPVAEDISNSKAIS